MHAVIGLIMFMSEYYWYFGIFFVNFTSDEGT